MRTEPSQATPPTTAKAQTARTPLVAATGAPVVASFSDNFPPDDPYFTNGRYVGSNGAAVAVPSSAPPYAVNNGVTADGDLTLWWFDSACGLASSLQPPTKMSVSVGYVYGTFMDLAIGFIDLSLGGSGEDPYPRTGTVAPGAYARGFAPVAHLLAGVGEVALSVWANGVSRAYQNSAGAVHQRGTLLMEVTWPDPLKLSDRSDANTMLFKVSAQNGMQCAATVPFTKVGVAGWTGWQNAYPFVSIDSGTANSNDGVTLTNWGWSWSHEPPEQGSSAPGVGAPPSTVTLGTGDSGARPRGAVNGR